MFERQSTRLPSSIVLPVAARVTLELELGPQPLPCEIIQKIPIKGGQSGASVDRSKVKTIKFSGNGVAIR